MSGSKRMDRGSENGTPVFSWDAPEVFLALGLDEQRASLESLASPDREMWLRLLEEDPRKGRRQLARRLRRTAAKHDRLEERWRQLSDFDARMAEGQVLAGVDEVGRGPLAGPVTVAAVILPPDFHAPGLDDSKRMSAPSREAHAERIREKALDFALIDLDAGEVDRLGIRRAVLRAMSMSLEGLSLRPARVLVDGRELPPGLSGARAVIGGDGKSLCVAAASVLAKVHRDAIMREMHLEYPEYGFTDHKGYGSADHIAAIRRLGPCPIHRRSFLGRILFSDAATAGR